VPDGRHGHGARRPLDRDDRRGDLDLRGTLGLDREVGAGFQAIRLRFAVDAPDATEEQLDALLRKTERYCTVAQTLLAPPALDVALTR
jgi:organic hydroperoxide reductase OsmC/OhrA